MNSPFFYVDIDMSAFADAVSSANALEIDKSANGYINPSLLNGSILTATGKIPQHNDEDFAPWAHILVLRSNDAILTIRGGHKLPLPVGRLVRFNAHRHHGLIQARNSLFVWVPILDAPDPQELDDVLIKRALDIAQPQ